MCGQTIIASGRKVGPVVGDGKYLRISEVLDRLREAGYPDSESTVRRLVDAGELESYRPTIGGHRRITSASVDALISRRQAAPPGDLPVLPE